MSKNEEIAVLQENTPMRKWSFEPNVHIHAHEVSWF